MYDGGDVLEKPVVRHIAESASHLSLRSMQDSTTDMKTLSGTESPPSDPHPAETSALTPVDATARKMVAAGQVSSLMLRQTERPHSSSPLRP